MKSNLSILLPKQKWHIKTMITYWLLIIVLIIMKPIADWLVDGMGDEE